MRKLTDLKQEKTQSDSVGKSLPHESAVKHVTGKATFVDDQLGNFLHAYPVLSPIAYGKCIDLDCSTLDNPDIQLSEIQVIRAKDIPGHNEIGPVFSGDPLIAETTIDFVGQVVGLIVAKTYEQARKAARQIKVVTESLTPQLTLEDAIANKSWVRPPHQMRKQSADSAPTESIVISETLKIGGQEHFYLEGQIATATPNEDGGMFIHTSSQHPSEVQKLVAEVLGVHFSQVTVEMRRMGGGFGGKETQAAQSACLAAIAANMTGQPVKCRLARVDDMCTTGKRHPFTHHYQAQVNPEGLVQNMTADIYGHCGYSPDLSDAIVDRAMFHASNAYDYPIAEITGYRAKLNTQSHTAFRGFGGPQGMLLGETLMDDIAYTLGIDPLTVRLQNLAKEGTKTHYGQRVDASNIAKILDQLATDAEYHSRKKAIEEFNRNSPIIKKGIALTPVKFGISFTAQHLNQAGALIHIYTDGSVHLNHGGTEMGQGLNTKVAQIVSHTLGVSLDKVSITATRTDKVPNTSPTAASSGTDLNGMAALNAANELKSRLTAVAIEHFGFNASSIKYNNNQIADDHQSIDFSELTQKAYMERVSLSTTGFYKTPKIHYNREKASGRPFFYYAEGAAISEVMLDTLTGENRVTRVDILHDVGQSINPALDKGQIEGAFIQGMGWLTTEKLVWNDKGELLSNSPATYKIPSIGDTPPIFNVRLFESKNLEATVFRSKAVGEPPFMLAISVHSALRNAVASINHGKFAPRIHAPATCEELMNAIIKANNHKEKMATQGRETSCA